MSIKNPERRRRTQPERRAETRAALLDATIDCLVEEGYANTTTRGIAQRAGVTPGALQHHFASKAELVAAAAGWIVQRLIEEQLSRRLPELGSADLAEQLLDATWETHKGPSFAAIGELFTAARNDPDLHDRLAETHRTVSALSSATAAHLFPTRSGPQQEAVLTTCLATLRGLATVGYASEADRDAAWPATRAHLLSLFATLREHERGS